MCGEILNRHGHLRKAELSNLEVSAHTFLPCSGNGGTQAIEDAISLATCLQIAGKSNVPWAVNVHNKLRYVLSAAR